MDKKELLERIQFLENQKSQAIANANACDGAIQDCKWWLEKIEKVSLPDVSPNS